MRPVVVLGLALYAGCNCQRPPVRQSVHTHAKGATSSIAEPEAEQAMDALRGERGNYAQPGEKSDFDPVTLRKHAGTEEPRSQLLACGELGFVRLLPTGFEGYSYHDRKLTFRSDSTKFTHVVSQPGHNYLMLGPTESLSYYQPSTLLQPLARLPALGPFEVWPDVRSRQWVWVHYLRDDAVHRFDLPVRSTPHAGETAALPLGQQKAELLETVPLPGFDGRALARSFAGEWLFNDLRRRSDHAPLLFSAFGRAGRARAEEARVIFSQRMDARDERVVPLSGYPFSMVESEGRVALVTHRIASGRRQWQLEVVDARGTTFYVDLPHRAAHTGDDAFAAEVNDRSVCLVPRRPWVAVGGKTAVRLIDYTTGELLSVE